MEKNPGISAVLSFFIPGLGQIYSGRLAIGLLFMLVVWPAIIVLTLMFGIALSPWLLFVIPFAWIVNIVDAYKEAEKINQES